MASRLRSSHAVSRHGAITFSCGARAAKVLSKRTWSLPLPVQPCATASQLVSSAAFTCASAMHGRAMLVPSR